MHHVLILAGGAGTRLWPMSTESSPKQFQSLISNRSLLQETWDRLDGFPPERIHVSTSTAYAKLVAEQLPELPKANIIVEPCRRGTGPGIGLAAALIAQKDPEATIAALSADHSIQDNALFLKTLKSAFQEAEEKNQILLMGITPSFPNVNLGYIEVEAKSEGEITHPFKAFKEKPDLETAQKLIENGKNLWNAGYFIFRASSMLQHFEELLPKTYAALKAIQEGAPLESEYSKCDDITIDYGIMERIDSHEVRVIPLDCGWNDIGTWASLQEELVSENTNNVQKGQVHLLDCEGSLVYNTEEHLIAAFGLKDMVVVHTKDATLICPKAQSSALKDLLRSFHAK